MYLDAGKAAQVPTPVDVGGHTVIKGPFPMRVFSKWELWAPSNISHHGVACCEHAREWVNAMDRTELGASDPLTGPRWLRQRYVWGASSFPIFWCDAVERKKLDCGALAALAAEVFSTRGVAVMRVQMVQRFSEHATFQWNTSWNSDDSSLPWTHGELIYHEGCAVQARNGRIKVWDSSAGWWIDPKSGNGYGSLLALKVSTFDPSIAGSVEWGHRNIPLNSWIELDS
jgi:hypothetical protein